MVQAGALTSASEHEGPGSEDEDSGAGSGGEMPAGVAGGASSGANANGGFFVTSGAGQDTGQDTLRAGNLESVITRLQNVMSSDGRDSNEDKAQYFIDRFIPALQQGAHIVKQEYTHEYGASLLGGPGCQCFCGKCHMNHDLPFADMRAFLYTKTAGGEAEVILTCSEEQAAQLERNGARPVRWTAFGRSHTAEHIDEKCPPQKTDQQHDVAVDGETPEWFELDEQKLPSDTAFSGLGLPKPFTFIASKVSWTPDSLNDFFHKPMRYRGNIYPPGCMWPVKGNKRRLAYHKGSGTTECKTAKQYGDQNFKDAAKCYWWIHQQHATAHSYPHHAPLSFAALDNHMQQHKPPNPDWVELARNTASTLLGLREEVLTKYDACNYT